MGNYITFKSEKRNIDRCIYISNGLTTLFISVLVLSGSSIASRTREKELTMWFAEHDYAVCGLGTYGFDITDIPWTIQEFEFEKKFILSIIGEALNKKGWSLLPYKPVEEDIFRVLEEFKGLIQLINIDDVNEDKFYEWKSLADKYPLLKPPDGFPKCPKHEVYLHYGGCVICNDI